MFNVVVGITGHRDIFTKDINAITHSFDKLLNQLWQAFPQLNIRIIVGLAEGADTVIAQQVLKLAQQGKAIELVSVLPMPLVEYRNDFNGQALNAFEQLISDIKAANFPIVELPNQAQRDDCYVNLGHYLVNKSDILVSIWNGKHSTAVGGTSDVTHRFVVPFYGEPIGGTIQERASLFNAGVSHLGSKAVYHICVSRQSDVLSPNVINERFLYSSNGYDYEESSELPLATKQYLNSVNDLCLEVNAIDDKGLYSIAPNAVQAESSDLRQINQTFAKIDAAANNVQKKVNHAHFIAALFSIVIGGALSLFKSLNDIYLITFYSFAVVFAFSWYLIAKPNQAKAKYAFYRTLSESLRIEYFLHSVGVVNETGKYSIAQVWQGHGNIKENSLLSIIRQSSLLSTPTKYNKVETLNQWILDQKSYYSRARKRLSEKKNRLSILVKVAMYFPILFVLVVIGFSDFSWMNSGLYNGYSLREVLVLLTAFLPIVGAVIAIHIQNQSYLELINQYQVSFDYLSQVEVALTNAESEQKQRAIFFAAGLRLSQEHANWMSIIFQKNISPQTSI